MVPFVSVVGRGKTGKTTLVKNLIRDLGKLGYKVGVIKHDPLDHGEVDRKGSDTSVFWEEGSHAVILASPTRITLFQRTEKEQSPEQLFALCGDVDCIILEGYKTGNYPKLFLWTGKKDLDVDPLWNLLAIIYAKEEEAAAIKHFAKTDIPLYCRDDSKSIASLVEEYLFKKSNR